MNQFISHRNHYLGTYLLRLLLILTMVSSSSLQLDSMNLYQTKYNSGQGSEYAKLRSPENQTPNNDKIPPTPPAPSNIKSEVVDSRPNQDPKNVELQRMVQQLYMAQAQVQLEATEIRRAQSVATEAQRHLEEASNNVRVITTALRAAQENIATTAQRAQTAQLQLAAHDQLLFTARQKVDALSAQLVGLQAEVGISGDVPTVNVPALLDKLKEPLHPEEQPKPPLPLVNSVGSTSYGGSEFQTHRLKSDVANWNDYKQYVLDQQKNAMPHKLKRSSYDQQKYDLNRISPEEVKVLLDWIHEENRKDLLKE